MVKLAAKRKPRTPCSIKYESTWEAQIRDDQLLLCSAHTISHRWESAKALRRFIDREHQWVCNHLFTHLGRQGSPNYRVPELEAGSQTAGRFAPCSLSVKSCPACMMDYCINIGWHGRRTG